MYLGIDPEDESGTGWMKIPSEDDEFNIVPLTDHSA